MRRGHLQFISHEFYLKYCIRANDEIDQCDGLVDVVWEEKTEKARYFVIICRHEVCKRVVPKG